MNFVGAFLGQKVAHTVSGDDSTSSRRRHATGLVIVMAGLLGAITWNLITWYSACPRPPRTPSIGGLVGAAHRRRRRPSSGTWSSDKVVIPMVVSPLVAFALGVRGDGRDHVDLPAGATPGRANRGFKLAQTVSAAAMALGHGLQDAQKTMGVIFLALVAGGYVAADDRPARSG